MDAHPTQINPSISPVSSTTERSSSDLIRNLVQLIALKDRGTLAHSQRVHQLIHEWITYQRKRWLLLDVNIEAIEIAALIHDVGKVGVLDEILLKPEALSESERQTLEQHPEIGYQMIRDYPGSSGVALAIRHHHERWDGRGYPLGLKAKQIPLASRMIAIVDTYDAITSDRPYRKGRTAKEALEEIKNEAGRQFCPELASEFIQFMHARNT